MLETLRRWVPVVHEALSAHVLQAVTLSGPALDVVRRLLKGEAVTEETSGLSKREWSELMQALAPE